MHYKIDSGAALLQKQIDNSVMMTDSRRLLSLVFKFVSRRHTRHALRPSVRPADQIDGALITSLGAGRCLGVSR